MISLEKIRFMRGESLSLAEQVYNRLFSDIVTGSIPGGTNIVASALAKQLGVSITPVREAVQRLSFEGFISPIPRVGYIVEDMSDQDVFDLFVARAGIEQFAAKLSVKYITDVEISHLEENLGKMDEALALDQTEIMANLDTYFHQFIARASRNKYLEQVNQLLIQRTLRFRKACLHIREIALKTRDGHQRIIEALRNRNEKGVEEAILSHLEDTKKQISDHLKNLKQKTILSQDRAQLKYPFSFSF